MKAGLRLQARFCFSVHRSPVARELAPGQSALGRYLIASFAYENIYH